MEIFLVVKYDAVFQFIEPYPLLYFRNEYSLVKNNLTQKNNY